LALLLSYAQSIDFVGVKRERQDTGLLWNPGAVIEIKPQNTLLRLYPGQKQSWQVWPAVKLIPTASRKW
jgi:hypothetical protein